MNILQSKRNIFFASFIFLACFSLFKSIKPPEVFAQRRVVGRIVNDAAGTFFQPQNDDGSSFSCGGGWQTVAGAEGNGTLIVRNASGGNSDWDCNPGPFYNRKASGSGEGPHTFTLTPPAGYDCSSDVRWGIGYPLAYDPPASAVTSGNGCVATVYLGPDGWDNHLQWHLDNTPPPTPTPTPTPTPIPTNTPTPISTPTPTPTPTPTTPPECEPGLNCCVCRLEGEVCERLANFCDNDYYAQCIETSDAVECGSFSGCECVEDGMGGEVCGHLNEPCCQPDNTCDSRYRCVGGTCVRASAGARDYFCDESGDPTEEPEDGSGNPRPIYTAIGCIPVDDKQAFTAYMITWAIGIGGGLAVLLIAYAGFLFLSSQGNPQKLRLAKTILAAALTGIVMLIFSATLLRIIGVDILGLQ